MYSWKQFFEDYCSCKIRKLFLIQIPWTIKRRKNWQVIINIIVMSNKLDISKSLLLEFFWKYWEPSFENHIGIMIQFILWSEWLLLNSLFNGVVLFHINGRNLILMYYVAVTSGIWHSSLKCQSRFLLFNWKTCLKVQEIMFYSNQVFLCD